MTLNPKKLFLIDGLGALLSAFLLGVILVRFESYFGMPRQVLYWLSFAACIFAIYDFSCYVRFTKSWRPFLMVIATANLVYCCVSIGLVFHHYQQLTSLGVIYFVLELTILIILISIELKTVAKQTPQFR